MTTASSASILGFAGCTSLGYSIESSLAAMGAGLANFSDTNIANELGQPATAASLFEADVPRGERLSTLTRYGFADLQPLLSRYGIRRLPVLVGIPADLSPTEQESVRAILHAHPAVSEIGWFPYGRASTFAALAGAIDALNGGSQRFILVAGLDSLCAPLQVSTLVRAGRVLSPLTEGAVPGEAAAFALLARTDDPIVDAATSVRIEAVALQRAEAPFTGVQVVSADGLTAAFRTLRKLGVERVHRIIAAHSGEGYFGRSFAHAYLREIEVMPQPLTVELIADRVGDVGAAAGVLGLAFAMYFMARDMVQDRPNGRARALAYSESDTGQVGAAIIDGVPTSWQRSTSARG
jgi:3-oxoacyl-[acyl-carrier-protein] synthase I